jgi:hypothetical protein
MYISNHAEYFICLVSLLNRYHLRSSSRELFFHRSVVVRSAFPAEPVDLQLHRPEVLERK